MSYSDLSAAVAELKKILAVSGRDDILQQAVVSTAENISDLSKLLQLVFDIVDGGTSTKDIISNIQEFEKSAPDVNMSSLVSVFYDIDGDDVAAGSINSITGDQTNTSPGSSSKASPQVSLIQVHPVYITPGSRMADAAAILMNSVPSYEWSRAIPLLNVTLLLGRPAVDNSGKVTALSLGRFLVGEKTVEGTERKIIESAELGSEESSQRAAAGMELFTSPQTLVNANEGRGEGGESVRYSPVLDVFRPFMSLKRLELSIANMGAGLIPYKHGKLNLTLHDRSRLGEIADLVRPDLYSSTEMLIEYGWSHHDGGAASTNSFGKLINASRIKEKYGIKNSSFSFEEGGHVEITLELVTKGATDMATSKIAETNEVLEAVKAIENLTEIVSSIREKISASPLQKEIAGTQFLDSTSDLSLATSLTPEVKAAIGRFLHPPAQPAQSTLGAGASDPASVRSRARRSVSRSRRRRRPKVEPDQDTKEIIDVLTKLLGDSSNGTDGAVGELENALVKSFKAKSNSLSEGEDPMLKTGLPIEIQSRFPSTEFVSLGKILLRYVAEPLTATGRFDEVQVITYAFNAGAGAMRNANVGSLPIGISKFKEEFKSYTDERNRFNLTIREFLEYLINSYVDDITQPAYGISDKDEYSAQIAKGILTTPAATGDGERTILNTRLEEQMKKLGMPDGEFTPPKVTFHLETVPRAAATEEEFGDLNYSLLRIHVFDETATPYGMYLRLLDAMKNRHLGTIGVDVSTEEGLTKHRDHAGKVLKAAEEAGLVEAVNEETGVWKMGSEATPARIKRFVAARVPYIRYGTSASGIKTCSMRSIQDALLSTDHMQRMGLGDPSAAPGVDGDIVPLRMLPTELEMETIGNPYFTYGQQFFVDMDTGTTVDNIYLITGATYTLEQGKFDTSVKLINMQAFGTYRSAVSSIQAAVDFLKNDKG